VISTDRSSSARRRLGHLAPLTALVGVALVFSGCLSSGYTYLSHTTSSDRTVVYFKLPSSWTRFSFSADAKAANGALTQTQVNQIQAGTHWYVSFTSAKHAKPNLNSNLAAYHPQGLAYVAQLSGTQRDGFSLSSLRSQVLGTDPLSANATAFNVLSYREFTLPGGIRGSRLTTDIADRGGVTDTFEQIVEVDAQTNWVFAVAVGCRASCWAPNEGTINQILNAWNVKELVHG